MTLAQSATRTALQGVTRLTRSVLTLEAAAIAAVLALGAALRFVGLDWDHGHHQHPDERFLSMVLTQIQPAPDLWAYFDPGQSPLNPFNHEVSFFVYGTFPLFLVESLARALGRGGYDEAYLVGRALSALFDLGTVLLVYLLGRRLLGAWPAVLAAALLALAVHSIQIAHFFAVDTFATFFATLTLWLLVRYSNSGGARSLGLAGIAAGLAMASKLSTGLLLALFAGWWALTVVREGVLSDTWARRGAWLAHAGTFGVLAALTFRLFQPYAFAVAWPWDWRPAPAFTNALAQQQAIQTGTLDWPPGIQWAGTAAWLYPLEQIVRWGAGPAFGLAALAGLGIAAVAWWRTREHALALPLAWAGLNFPGLRRVRAQDHALLPPGLPGAGAGDRLDVRLGLEAPRAAERPGRLGRRRGAGRGARDDAAVGPGLYADLRARPHGGRRRPNSSTPTRRPGRPLVSSTGTTSCHCS